MQKILKTISVLIFVAFAAFTLTNSASASFNPALPAAVNADAPKDLYIRNCARCHGADGAGQTDLGQKLDVPDLSINGRRTSASKISRIIANGKDEMPGFAGKLTKKQIAVIAAYVRKL